MLWISDTSNSNTPIRGSALMTSVEETYPEPGPFQGTITVAIPDVHFNPLDHLGDLVATSPEEERLTALTAVQCDMESGDEDKIKAWACYLRQVPMKFVLMPNNNDRHFYNVKAREQATRMHHLLSRSQYGRMVETWNFKAAYPTPLSNKELVALYALHLSKKVNLSLTRSLTTL